MDHQNSSPRKRKRSPITQPALYHPPPQQATNVANGSSSPIGEASKSHNVVPDLKSPTPDQEAQKRVCSSLSHEAKKQTSKRVGSLSPYEQAVATQLPQPTPLPTPPQSLSLPPDSQTATDHSTLHPSPSHIQLTRAVKKELDRLPSPASHCQR